MTTGRIGFRDRHLGPWSSHPAFLRRRSRIWAMLGFLPLLVGVVVVLGAWRFGTVSLLSLVRQWNTWLPLALALLAFGFAAAVTVLLIARASTVPALQAAGRGRGRLGFGIAFAALLAALAYAFTRADLLRSALSPQSIAGLRLVGHLLGTLPVFLLIAGLELGGAAVDQWGEPAVGRTRWQKIRRGIALGAMLLAYLLPMLWLDRIVNALDLFAAHQRDPVAHPANSVVSDWQRWIPGFDHDPASTPAGGTLPDLLTAAHDALAAIAVLLPLVGLTGFVLFSASSLLAVGKAGREPVDADEVAKAEGYDLRPTGESWDANDGRSPRPVASRWRATDAEREAEAPAVVVAEPPEWLAQVREVLAKQQPCEWGEVRRADGVEASPTSDRRDLAHLFATAFDAASGQSEPPTKDQVAALEEFDRLFEAFLIAEDREGTCVFPSTDLLVTGAPGSGRTTLLLAVALHAVVLRGQSVLLLAPSVEKAALYVRRLRDLAARGGVGWHVAVGQILPDDVRSWADGVDARQPAAEAAGAHRSPVGSLPDILVGTPHDYERCLYGADHHHAAVRRALLRLQVVLLEDVATFSVAERRHLPFLIEKHRLVLASEHLPTQFLALAPDLTAEAASYLTERLFSERAKVPVRRLRPAARPAPWVLDLAAASPSATAEALAAACAAADLRVVLWRPGAGKEDRERLAATLGEKAARVQVVADLDELPADDGVTADIAVYRSLTAQQHTLALSSHVAGVDTVLVRVTRPGVLVPAPEADKTLPVLPSVESEALFVAHLQSAARFFAPFTPAPRDLFARIGLRTAGQLLGLPRRAADFEALPGVSLRLDPPERHAEPVPASRGRSWAWVALDVDGYSDRRQPPPPCPVEMLRPLPRGSEVRRDVGDDRVVLGKAAVDERALAAWVTQQNESLDRMDLACADDLMHRHGDQAFVPRHIESAEDGLRIRGEPFRDKDQGERYLPLFDAAVTVPPKARAEGDQGGVAPRVLRWFHVREAARADARVQAQFWLTGAFDATGGCHRLSPPAPLHYAIRLGALLLGPEQAAAGTLQADRDERTHRAFAGVWDTRRRSHAAGGGALRPRPWPALGLALTAGLREALPGLFDYCRLAAHRGPADGVNDARAFVLFFEPLATRDTVGSAMRKLLMDADLTVAVLAAARRRLAAVDPRDFDTLANLLVEGRALVGDGWYDEHADGEQALATDVTDAMALLDGTMAEVRAKAQRGDRLREKRRAAEGDAE